MLRERVSDDIYVFTSEVYAQVTAGVVVYPEGAVLIDTLPFPFETAEIKDFVEKRLNTKVQYILFTHYHADHTNGAYLFPEAHVVGHQLCRLKLDTVGRTGMARAKEQAPELAEAPSTVVDALKTWRLAEARRRRVPAFRVLTDKALLGIAVLRPRSSDGLSEVQGVGPKAIQSYGAAIIEVVSKAEGKRS